MSKPFFMPIIGHNLFYYIKLSFFLGGGGGGGKVSCFVFVVAVMT